MLGDWIKLLRPRQWTKNLFVLAPLVFARKMFEPRLLALSLLAFVLFCVLSSAVYIINDAIDIEEDRRHPLKRNRPLAAGRVAVSHALLLASVLAASSLVIAWLIHPLFGPVMSAYLALNILYSLWLKKVPIVDLVSIAAGFVLRVVGGAEVIQVDISRWLVLCTFCLAFFLGLGKRHHELLTSNSDSRRSLAGLSPRSLTRWEYTTLVVTMLAYLAYTMDPETVSKFNTHALALTSPFCLVGMLRYLKLVHRKTDLTPTDALVTDLPSVLNVLGWGATAVGIIYFSG
ncbi:MAG: decaprenyl-phosphate phosphoribosyltransferase [Deltaproteobacteria bacterium]|nr:MAG: decaprenyl-phosphate phosphoribosyltransferase [Deltaproteobacteria bacterium]